MSGVWNVSQLKRELLRYFIYVKINLYYYPVVLLCEINKSIVLVCITFCNRLVLHFQAFSQLFSKTPDLKSPLLNLVHVFSDGVISFVYVDDRSCLKVLVSCSMRCGLLHWCVDWISHRFSPNNFIYTLLPFIMLVIVFVDSTLGCSIPISCSLALPLI